MSDIACPCFALLAQNPDAGAGSIMTMLPMIGVIAVLWILLMWLPQRKEQQKTQALLDGLKKNDRVLLASGILGIVVSAQPGDKYLTVRIDEGTGTKIRVLRTSVVRVVTDEDEAEAK